MKKGNELVRAITLLLGGALAIAPALQARTCSGNADVVGSYGWLAGRSVEFAPVASTPPGTTVVGSLTNIGVLASGTANSAAFASVGWMYFDGNGGLYSSAAPGGPISQVGSYKVNTDCTISATITDSFATPGGAGLTPVQASVTFEGVIVQNDNEIDLTQTGAPAGTQLTFKKTSQFNSCTNAALAGTFGLASTGVVITIQIFDPTVGLSATSTSTTPFSLVGRFVADGQGNLVEDAFAAASPLTQRKITGTYSVNTDCTGTAVLTGADGTARKANFVMVNEKPGSSNSPQAIEFAFTGSGVVGSGTAQQQ